jgi:hypothetical protein
MSINKKSNLSSGMTHNVCVCDVAGRRANEGGTTDLPDYSETVPRDRTLFKT